MTTMEPCATLLIISLDYIHSSSNRSIGIMKCFPVSPCLCVKGADGTGGHTPKYITAIHIVSKNNRNKCHKWSGKEVKTVFCGREVKVCDILCSTNKPLQPFNQCGWFSNHTVTLLLRTHLMSPLQARVKGCCWSPAFFSSLMKGSCGWALFTVAVVFSFFVDDLTLDDLIKIDLYN